MEKFFSSSSVLNLKRNPDFQKLFCRETTTVRNPKFVSGFSFEGRIFKGNDRSQVFAGHAISSHWHRLQCARHGTTDMASGLNALHRHCQHRQTGRGPEFKSLREEQMGLPVGNEPEWNTAIPLSMQLGVQRTVG